MSFRGQLQHDAQSGFTLVELLIVIGIITVLISILLPVINRAREQALALRCMANQHAIGIAMQTYASSHNGGLPNSESWIFDLEPYFGGTYPNDPTSFLLLGYNRHNMPGVLFCPCDDDPFPKPYVGNFMELTSYFLNGAFTDLAMGSGRPIRLGLFGGNYKLSSVRFASECMMLGETSNWGGVADLDAPAAQAALAAVGSSLPLAYTEYHHRATSGFYHQGKMAVLFVDGHVAMVTGTPVAPWPLQQCSGACTAASLGVGFTFFPTLSLPTAADNPKFWGPPYYQGQ